MPRERLRPGEWGKITTREVARGKFTASTYVRDSDGVRRGVERSGPSREAAERNLKRHLQDRRAPIVDAAVNDRTTLAELFTVWIGTKDIAPQSIKNYRDTWKVHGAKQIGALRIREFPTSRAEQHLQRVAAKAPSAARQLRIVLLGMFKLAVRYDVLDHNPIREASRPTSKRKPVQVLSPEDFARVRAAIRDYCAGREGVGGPKPGRLLPAFVDVLISTGLRPNEVLGLRWHEVDLLATPPTVTVTGKLVPSGKVEGMPLHRQDYRKAGAPDHTVILPRLAVEALTTLLGESFPDGLADGAAAERPVFANRAGGWMDLHNLRRAFRAAMPEDLKWVVPYTTRRTVATLLRNELGPAQAQAQLSHAQLSTTERYMQRQTHGPDARAALDKYAGEGADGL
ncbi:site-specific integrase [Nocardia farcinica]|uniref:site-specific integrase n=1 Tax=Nocardia farcinica TaxID=37329 RepID=UPI001894457E|nr:site-specific integrase [Nocardia farcinica]MBF6233961.1 site-specific integrase [Nocardia farcinica]